MPRTSGRLCVMRMIFKAFTKKLFGRKYERLTQMLFIHLIVFWGLSISGFRTRIAPPVLYLTVTAVTAGVMWQALSSKDITAQIQHMLMLPFGQRNFVFSYTAALGLYAILTKTVTVLAILLAVSSWGFIEIVSCSLCAMQAVLMASAIFCLRRRHAAILWAACVPAAIVCLWAHPWFMLLPAANSIVSFFLLWHADGYSFCLRTSRPFPAWPDESILRALLPVYFSVQRHCRHDIPVQHADPDWRRYRPHNCHRLPFCPAKRSFLHPVRMVLSNPRLEN